MHPAAWWRQAFALLDRAVELPEGERAAWLRQACGPDATLAAVVASLLVGDDHLTFLDAGAIDFAAPVVRGVVAEDDPTPPTGARIGPYRLLREIGHGGMGTVYLAERADEQYERIVALKLLRGWGAVSERAVHRFLDERQILAALDHPDIARLLDGGVTPDGLPWFAMEYVAGEPIDRYCIRQGLAVEQRLALFARVCGAVQYAHRNLVVHRDLKPANILVTADGAVKLLDFGIAKLLGTDPERQGSQTATADRMLTPRYAAPEQIRGGATSTATDVYALGVVLYELLTGVHPHAPHTLAPHEVVHAILDQEPARPSVVVLRPHTPPVHETWPVPPLAPAKLARRLRGDLDTVVLKAMQQDPARRYASAEQVETDIRRHLRGLPVTARPDTRRYRLQKFVRRHRLGVTIAGGVTLLVAGFLTVTGIQGLRLRAQAARIVAERDRATRVGDFLAGLFQSTDPFGTAGAALTARAMLDSGAARVQRELADLPEIRAQLLLEIARAYFGLGARDRARRFAELSLAVRRRATPARPREIAQTLDVLGAVRLDQGELDGAERAYREALALQRRTPDAEPAEISRALHGLAGVLHAAGRFRDAESAAREAVALDRARPAADPLDLARSVAGLAAAVRERGDHGEAVDLTREALALRRRALPEPHAQVAASVLDLAAALGDAGDAAGADSLFRYGLALQRQALGDDHPDVAVYEARYARLLHRRGADSAAETSYRRSLATMRLRVPAAHPRTAGTLLGLGVLLLDRGSAAAAEPLLREALAMRRTTLPPEHPAVAEAEQAVGAAVMARGRYVEAERYLLASHQALRTAYGDADPRVRTALARVVRLYELSGLRERAASYPADIEGSVPPATARGSAAVDHAPIVAVFPFQIAPGDRALMDLRDVAQDLLAARMTGEGFPRAVDPAALARALRAGGLDGEAVPTDARQGVAARLGAAWIVDGRLTGTSERVTLDATLRDVASAVPVAMASVAGSADSLPYLADRLAARLVAIQVARDSTERDALLRPSPAALAAYLAGVDAERRGDVGVNSGASRQFERALFLDPAFALARLRVAEIAAVYGMSELDERWKLETIWDHRHELGAADHALLLAYLGPRYPAPSTPGEIIAASERAAAAQPHRAEGWRLAGLNLFRLGAAIGAPGWDARARAALERAAALDSTHVPTLAHLTLLAAAHGEPHAVRRYADLHGAHARGPPAEFIRWVAATVLGDSASRAAVGRRFAELPRLQLRLVAGWSQALGVGLEDGDRAARLFEKRAASAAERRTVTVALVPHHLNRGRPGEARRLLAGADRGFGRQQDVGVLDFRVFAALHWDGDTSDAAAAVRALEAYLDGAPESDGRVRDRATAACTIAHWRLARGDVVGAAAARERLRQHQTSVRGYPVSSVPICAAAVDAQLAAARQSPDAAAALERLDTLLRAGTDVRHLLPAVATLTAARLLEARGEVGRALALMRRETFWWWHLLSTRRREEGRLAALVGDTATAIWAYRQYLALRADPEPGLRPHAERVRTELARLER